MKKMNLLKTVTVLAALAIATPQLAQAQGSTASACPSSTSHTFTVGSGDPVTTVAAGSLNEAKSNYLAAVKQHIDDGNRNPGNYADDDYYPETFCPTNCTTPSTQTCSRTVTVEDSPGDDIDMQANSSGTYYYVTGGDIVITYDCACDAATTDGTCMMVFPNPANTTMMVQVDLFNPVPVTVHVYDQNGVFQFSQFLGAHPVGLSDLPVNISALTPGGPYSIQVEMGSTTDVLQFMVN